MNADMIHLFWIFFWLALINVFIFVMWAVMAMGSRLSREEEQREAQHRRKYQ